jgi:hypothetical protein
MLLRPKRLILLAYSRSKTGMAKTFQQHFLFFSVLFLYTEINFSASAIGIARQPRLRY